MPIVTIFPEKKTVGITLIWDGSDPVQILNGTGVALDEVDIERHRVDDDRIVEMLIVSGAHLSLVRENDIMLEKIRAELIRRNHRVERILQK